MKEPKENEWWMCLSKDSSMKLRMIFFYKNGEWWSASNEWNEVKEPFSASRFYGHDIEPLFHVPLPKDKHL